MPERDLYAAVDLGSNSFHLLVVRREHGQFRAVDRLREMVRLAGGLDGRGRLERDTRDRALACLARFGQRIAGIPERQVRAVGTQTFRRMDNAAGFLVPAETALGFPIEIIGGREEARLVYLGVTHGVGFTDRGADTGAPAGNRLVVDIGGGSTEVVLGRGAETLITESLPYGCVSVTREAFPDGRISAKRWKRAAQEIAAELRAVAPAVRTGGWRQAVGSSGTVRAVQSMASAGGMPRAIEPGDLEALKRDFLHAGHIDRIRCPGLSGHRQPVIAGGVLILEACIKTLGIDKLEVSPFALREGLLFDLIGRGRHGDPRQVSVVAMGRRHEVDQAQAERVRDFALAALDQVAEVMEFEDIHRLLLDWTCRLHEVGLAIAHSGHPAHGAYIIEHSDMAGFSRQEQQFMAVLVGAQRDKLSPDCLAPLPERLRAPARGLLVLLRLAVALCRARSDADLPDFALLAETPLSLTLALPEGWLEAHPLSARDLAFEQRQLARLSVRLETGRLDAPHPVRAAGEHTGV